ncbi:MAG: glycosyltransferase family 9 protein [Chloroflexaceae bacterium]|nr:glycosyltransferase family 9 protein [Chloroflexaceae bacterium]
MQSILFIELLGGIGDLLLALPAIQSLARSHPQAQLRVLTYAPGGMLLCDDPHVYDIIIADRHSAHATVAAVLARRSFDLIVSTTNHSGIPELIAQQRTVRTVTNLWRSPPPDQRVADRFLQILQAEDLITPQSIAPARLYLSEQERQQARVHLPPARPLVFLVPDAGMAIKRWPMRSYIELGRALQQRYQAHIVVPMGNDPEQTIMLVAALDSTAQVWPRGDLHNLAAALSFADLVVAPDTGIAHIAAALAVPTITLFGPSWYERYGHPAPHINLQGYTACPERNIANFTEQTCWYASTCPLAMWHTCLEDIPPTAVLQAVRQML